MSGELATQTTPMAHGQSTCVYTQRSDAGAAVCVENAARCSRTFLTAPPPAFAAGIDEN